MADFKRLLFRVTDSKCRQDFFERDDFREGLPFRKFWREHFPDSSETDFTDNDSILILPFCIWEMFIVHLFVLLYPQSRLARTGNKSGMIQALEFGDYKEEDLWDEAEEQREEELKRRREGGL